MNNPKKIIIHHSYSPDNQQVNDWAAMKRYHMSWRYNSRIITPEKAGELISQGVKGVEKPWTDIGYHAGQEYEGWFLVQRIGRAEYVAGAHCLGCNSTSLGYCFVGRFDMIPPTEEELAFAVPKLAAWARKYGIPVTSIEPHRKYASYKSCPGTVFPMARLQELVKQAL